MSLYRFYRIVNNKDDKCYIGQTISSLEIRFRGHKSKLNSTSKILFDTYGPEKLEEVKTEDPEIITPLGI